MDYTATYYYDESYFSKPSTAYNPSLATMSLCLELSAWGSNEDGGDYSNKAKNARTLLEEELGFEDFEVNECFETKPEEDSFGVVAAHKDITAGGKEYTLIAVAPVAAAMRPSGPAI